MPWTFAAKVSEIGDDITSEPFSTMKQVMSAAKVNALRACG